jgi:hypothetical protein
MLRYTQNANLVITEIVCVYCAVRTESLNIIQAVFIFNVSRSWLIKGAQLLTGQQQKFFSSLPRPHELCDQLTIQSYGTSIRNKAAGA